MLVGEAFSERTIVETETAPDAGMAQEEEIAELKAGFDTEDGVRPTKTSRGNGPKRLRFGSRMWDGDGEGKEEARWLRACLGIRDGDVHVGDDPSGEIWLLGWTVREEDHSEKTVTTLSTTGPTRGRKPIQSSRSTTAQAKKSTHRPKIIMLDEEQTADPLEGYEAPSPSSSRSPSPTPSYLEEVTADPSLAFDSVQKKKVTRPVYISQLVALLSERDKPDSLEMGLKWGESLIRAKRSFGGELGEPLSSCLDPPIAHLVNRGERPRSGFIGHCAKRPIQPRRL
jgi:telomere length regulation protein